MPLPRRRLVLVAVLGLGALVTACGYQGDDGAGDRAERDPFPPSTEEELAEIFDPMVEDLGLEFTYGSLSLAEEAYREDPEGDHLALYVEPIDEEQYTRADYVEHVGTLAARLTPFVFETWPGLTSYDVCQEPPPSVDAAPEPAPYTQMLVDREEYERADWEGIDTAGVIAESQREGDPIFLLVTSPLDQEPSYLEALAEANGN